MVIRFMMRSGEAATTEEVARVDTATGRWSGRLSGPIQNNIQAQYDLSKGAVWKRVVEDFQGGYLWAVVAR